MKKLLLLVALVNCLLAKDLYLDIKYWNLPDLDYKDMIAKERDKDIYSVWINKRVPFTIVSNVTNEFAIRSFSTFYKRICSSNLTRMKDTKEFNRNCMLLAPGVSRNFSVKVYNYIDMNSVFDINPNMFVLNKELGIIVFNIGEGYEFNDKLSDLTKIKLKHIDSVISNFKKQSGLLDHQIVALGTFGVSKKSLETYVKSKGFKVALREKNTLIKKNSKYLKVNAQNIIYNTKNIDFLRKMEVESNIADFKKDYVINSTNENEKRKNFYEKVSPYYPLKIQVKHNFEYFIEKE